MQKWKITLMVPLLFMNCVIKAPEVSITGEKTALEEQVLGDYRRIEGDTWMIVSQRTVGGSASSSQQDIFEAVQGRKFNKDEIDDLKKDKVIGEDNQGFVQVLVNEKYDSDPRFKRYVDRLVEEENRDRQIIYERVLAAQKDLTPEKEKQLYRIFAERNFQSSARGTMIQQADGTWVEKE